MIEPVEIRPYLPRDLPAVREVCLRTAAAGQDATGLYSTDDLAFDVYARPYLEFAPDLAFVLQHDGRVSGYVLGVTDTREFVTWFRESWVPRLASSYEHVDPPLTEEQRVIHSGFTPDRMIVAEVDDHPAHLHINLLPAAQGQGRGRQLIERVLAELRARGVPGVHLGMDPANTGARAFYDRLGFVELPSSTPDETLLGMRL